MKVVFEMEMPESCEVCNLSHLVDGYLNKVLKCPLTSKIVTRDVGRRDPDCPLEIKREKKWKAECTKCGRKWEGWYAVAYCNCGEKLDGVYYAIAKGE